MDDDRRPPATDLPNDFYRRGTWVTQEQLHGEIATFRAEMRDGFMELRDAIKEARIEANEAHQRIRQDWTDRLTEAIDHRGRILRLETDAKEAIESRRWFWPQVIAVAGLVSTVFIWLVDKLQWRAHP